MGARTDIGFQVIRPTKCTECGAAPTKNLPHFRYMSGIVRCRVCDYKHLTRTDWMEYFRIVVVVLGLLAILLMWSNLRDGM